MSFGGTGKRDWLAQRFSALIIAAYTVWVLFFIISNQEIDFALWSATFSKVQVKIFSFFALMSICVHAWIGMWTICTDYLKCYHVRMITIALIAIFLMSSLLYGFNTLWSL